MKKNIKKTNGIEHIWSLMCSDTIVDKGTNNLSVFNIIEELNFNQSGKGMIGQANGKNSVVPINFNIAVLFKLSLVLKNNFRIRMDFVDPVGISLNSMEHNIEVPEKAKKIRFIARFNKMFVSLPGEYKVLISIKEIGEKSFKNVGSIPFLVNIK